ncbi:MAG: tRNA (adenosine(37)-N6)-dimethylallyltransferase MiaA [Patescibacteria group bacterium]
MSSKTHIICVIGPTASGKTAKAVSLAKEHNGEVISVDSRQVYRMLDIGTEKASKEEMGGIPHYLIDVKDPREIYGAGDFVTDATALITDITGRGKTPILAGGTHFYFDALLNGLPHETPADPEFRKTLETLSNEALFARIQAQDPQRAEKIDPHNRRRLTRALEVIEKHGRVPERTSPDVYEVEWVALMPEREELRERLEKRLKDAFTKGLIEEVRQVRAYVGDERLNELGLEYKIIGEYLRGERGEESLIPTLTAKLWQYAKHQMKWMRKLQA